MFPSRINFDDILKISSYFARKPKGATAKEVQVALGNDVGSARNIASLRFLGLLDDSDGTFRANEMTRTLARADETKRAGVLANILVGRPEFHSIFERVVHRGEKSLPVTDVGSHWHDHYRSETSTNEDNLVEQVTCFLQLVERAGLGTFKLGRRGQPTRIEFDLSALERLLDGQPQTEPGEEGEDEIEMTEMRGAEVEAARRPPVAVGPLTAPVTETEGIFVAHGKNHVPLEQLKKILDEFKIPYKVAENEPNLGRPIGIKVRQTMLTCNCAILIFTADEEFKDKDGNTIWRPSENVVHELGASSFQYENRIVILKEEAVNFPSNYREIGHITFAKDQLSAKAIEIIRELIGFHIVKIST